MTQKILLPFVFVIGINSICFSQASKADTIKYLDGKVVAVMLNEITDLTVKYKKASMPDGPTYVVNISELCCVTYRDGTKERFKQTQTNTNTNNPQSNNTTKSTGSVFTKDYQGYEPPKFNHLR
jgi:hypothetical protein